MTLPAFGELALYEEPLADGIEREGEWLAHAATSGIAAAYLWRAPQSLSVPRSYLRHAGWAQACALSHASGWPVHVRGSGGGLVPLGPGVANLSLVWRAAPAATVDPPAVYRSLCAVLSGALARLAIDARPQAVEGSFCDGRFNLAVGGRKIAGTAQAWRRVGPHRAVLAHAVIVVAAEPAALTETANRFEQALASGRHYRADALTSVARAWCEANEASALPADFDRRLLHAVAEELAAGHRAAAPGR